MKTAGFPISHKENEKRRAIIPENIAALSHPELIYIEKGFGEVLDISDDEYRASGCNVCSHEEVLSKDIVCDPKIGDAEYLESLNKGQIIFGWIHATQNPDITQKIISRCLTAYAWEKMFENNRHVFWFNNELAGEAAVMHGFQCYGKLPRGLDVAVIGNGNTSRGACRVLKALGANVSLYDWQDEELFKTELGKFDAVVNCIKWDVFRKDHVIFAKDLKRMKKNALIIDVSCDRNGGIETSVPTTIEKPVYFVDGIMHYAVDHTPSLFYKTFSQDNSKIIYPFVEELITDNAGKVLCDALIAKDGVILDPEIKDYQKL
jgi:N5-(carboxyethyl)ornithine synthase